MENRKQITEVEILARLKQPDWGLPPLVTVAVEASSTTRDTGVDAIIELGWKGKRYRFATEVRRLWTPKTVTDAAEQIQRSAERQSLSPLLVVPYLGAERLCELEARGVSGIDLCGNGVVVAPGELLVFRSGSPNQFRWEGQIKNVYRGVSAVVARVFLVVAEFPSVGEVLEQIRLLGGEVTLPAVPKVCKSLEQDLVIERKKTEKPARKLRVIQPEKLLDLLRNSYTPPDVTRTFVGKFSGPLNGLPERIQAMEKREKAKTVLCGASSVAAEVKEFEAVTNGVRPTQRRGLRRDRSMHRIDRHFRLGREFHREGGV